MSTKTSERIFLIISTIFIIISGNIVLVSAQIDTSGVSLRVSFSPDHVEQIASEHKIGYVWLENKVNNPITSPKDITVELKSGNPEIASTDDHIIIPAGDEFAAFSIYTHNVTGQARIFATYNDDSASGDLSVGEQDFTENNLRLTINLATSEMNVNSQMPFSMYLTNINGTITPAPFDIPISLEYEQNLIGVELQELSIKKGNSYIWGTIHTKDKVGNAFLRVTSDKLSFDVAKEIRISSSLPSSLAINIFPEKVPATVKRDVEVIVSLVDSDGLPTLAQEDVNVDFFSDDIAINNQIDKKIKDDSFKGIIKKGEFSLRFTPKLDFFKENQTVTIGAATKGLGVATDSLDTVKPITTSNPLAQNKTLQVFALEKIPTKSQSIAVYQMGILVDQKVKVDTGDTTSTEQTTTETKIEKQFFPLLINENYDSIGSEQKINIISSNDLVLKISDVGRIAASSSHGTSTIQTGQETGKVFLSSTIKGVGSASTTTEIINTLKQEQTMLFSPTGTNGILFDKNGKFDFFVISLDSKGRPTAVENEIKYLITPINEILTITKGNTFAHVNFQGDTMSDDTIPIKTIPIGESSNANLEISNTFKRNPTAQLSMSMPQNHMGSKHEYVGAVQLADFNGNPIVSDQNLQVKLGTSNLGIVQTPDFITIPAGKSYAGFTISTIKDGSTRISASSNGIVEAHSDIEVKTPVTKLKISVGGVDEPIFVEQTKQMKIYVDDEADNSVGGATVRVVSQDSKISPEIITTDDDGAATIEFNAQKSPKISLQILASAEGYTNDDKSIEFQVSENTETKKTELPDWMIYGAIAGVIAIGGGVFAFLRDPKKRKSQEDEDEIYD
ncbi:MAG: hypothetical protein EB164_08565 [Thaumarchaeota archaeon]|nr:hypothetical protein [Nitrososphaerota archaeon]